MWRWRHQHTHLCGISTRLRRARNDSFMHDPDRSCSASFTNKQWSWCISLLLLLARVLPVLLLPGRLEDSCTRTVYKFFYRIVTRSEASTLWIIYNLHCCICTHFITSHYFRHFITIVSAIRIRTRYRLYHMLLVPIRRAVAELGWREPCFMLMLNLWGGFELTAKADPPDPNPNPISSAKPNRMSVITAWMVCFWQGSRGWFRRLRCCGMDRLYYTVGWCSLDYIHTWFRRLCNTSKYSIRPFWPHSESFMYSYAPYFGISTISLQPQHTSYWLTVHIQGISQISMHACMRILYSYVECVDQQSRGQNPKQTAAKAEKRPQPGASTELFYEIVRQICFIFFFLSWGWCIYAVPSTSVATLQLVDVCTMDVHVSDDYWVMLTHELRSNADFAFIFLV